MFPAYKSDKEAESSSQLQITAGPSNWLQNDSFKGSAKRPVVLESDSDTGTDSPSSSTSSVTFITSFGSEDTKKKKKKKEKKKKKHKKSKKSHKSRSISPPSTEIANLIRIKDINQDLTSRLLDSEYQSFFAQFTKDQIKQFLFYEDVIGLKPRNAFRLNLKGDKNNVCFDSAYAKLVPKYDLSPSERREWAISKSKKKIGRKELRRQLLAQSRAKRYYVQFKQAKASLDKPARETEKIKLSQGALSNRLWQHLQQMDVSEETQDLTADFMKHLDENKNDVDKWLEFLDYQSTRTESGVSPASLYEKKQAILDRALDYNPDSFRLKIESVKLKAASVELLNIYNSVEVIENEFLSLLADESFRLTASQLTSKSINQIVSNLFEIWFEMIDFLLDSSSTSVYFDRIKQTFVKCFEFFLHNPSRELSSTLDKIRADPDCVMASLLIDLVDKYTRLLSTSGYMEKSIGIYQALLDFTLYEAGAKDKQTAFEMYWDMSLPRFGETRSLGWIESMSKRDELILQSGDEDNQMTRNEDILDQLESSIVNDKSERIELRWLEMEKMRSILNWYPFYARVGIGESNDDCVDSDRLLNYEDDFKFCLFSLPVESLKFKLLVKFLGLFGLFTIAEDNSNFYKSDQEDSQTLKHIAQLGLSSAPDMPVLNKTNLLETLYINYFQLFDDSSTISRLYSDNVAKLKSLFESEIKHLIEFLRQSLQQASRCFKSSEIKTDLIILEWRLELEQLFLLNKYKTKLIKILPQSGIKDLFDFEKIKQNLIARTRNDLSMEENRSNFALWKQYGSLKWLLSNSEHFGAPCGANNLKETRKIFDTLLTTSLSAVQVNDQACIDIYSLCVDYALVELGAAFKPHDIELITTVTSQLNISLNLFTFWSQVSLFKAKKLTETKRKEYNSAKERLSELIATHCLNKNESKLKTKSTFKIGMTGSTKLLLAKRDFQLEHDALVKAYSTDRSEEKKLFWFHQVYSMYLLCLNDHTKLIELNDSILATPILSDLYHSKLIEFYLLLVNILFYKEGKLSRHAYKSCLFKIAREMVIKKTKNTSISSSFLLYLQHTLTWLRVNNSTLFVNQIVENQDLDYFFDRTSLALTRSAHKSHTASSFQLGLIQALMIKLETMISRFKADEQASLNWSNIGIQHQIRRRFDSALRISPRSFQLWFSYFEFEIMLYKLYPEDTRFGARIMSVYYQSIRNLPNYKILYMNSIKCLPEKYNEIMDLMANRELRVCLPIQELNILLEPIETRQINDEEEMESEEVDSDEYQSSEGSIIEVDEDNESDQSQDDVLV